MGDGFGDGPGAAAASSTGHPYTAGVPYDPARPTPPQSSVCRSHHQPRLLSRATVTPIPRQAGCPRRLPARRSQPRSPRRSPSVSGGAPRATSLRQSAAQRRARARFRRLELPSASSSSTSSRIYSPSRETKTSQHTPTSSPS